MKPNNKQLAVIIPCHNEAENIADVIRQFPIEKLQQSNITLRIYVIDNNSSDNTAEIAQAMGATVITERAQGKGNALRAGFNSLPNDIDYVVMLDGDNTYQPQEICRLLEPLQTNFCDAVVGSRLGGRIQKSAMNKTNRIGNRLFTLATRLLYGTNISDVLTGYFAWKKPALDVLMPHVKSAGFAVEMEMITKMARLRHRLTSVPISYNPRGGQSHLRPFRDGMRILSTLIKNIMWRPRVELAITPKSGRKLVFVSDAIYPYMKGGKEKRLHEITTRLAAMGNDVHIYTMHWWKEESKIKVESGVSLHALCNYHTMYKGDRRTIKEGLIFGLSCFKLLGVRFDVLDVDHMPFFPLFSSWVVCLLRRRKLYATWHEALSQKEWINYMGPGGIVAALIERLSIKLPHRITAASAHTKELLAQVHGRNERVELVGSGIDTDLLQKVQPADISCDVLYLGRLVKDKNVDKLISAIGIAKRTRPDISCIILGEGIEKPRLQKAVARQKLQKNIIFLDSVPEAATVYSYMKAAKVFCSPSVREGFGIVSLEALGCGTPVITTNSPSNAARRLIQEGENGSIVPLVPKAISQAILYWISISKPNTAAQLDDYDWRSLARKQSEVYMS
jgi:glycosyltransferase involved in cell wall biosynthesis